MKKKQRIIKYHYWQNLCIWMKSLSHTTNCKYILL